MPTFTNGDTTINYLERGSGFPLLLIAPGGVRSSIEWWDNAPWNPIDHLGEHYRVIAMDQRNAGASTGPVTADSDWNTYNGDQLALLDHLGVDRFLVEGMCIGGSYSRLPRDVRRVGRRAARRPSRSRPDRQGGLSRGDVRRRLRVQRHA